MEGTTVTVGKGTVSVGRVFVSVGGLVVSTGLAVVGAPDAHDAKSTVMTPVQLNQHIALVRSKVLPNRGKENDLLMNLI
jgi:hypothetical protein